MSRKAQKSTLLYRRVLAQIEARRQELGWSCDRLERAAGLQSGYFQKVLHADTPSGRCATWPILDLLVTALFPKDFDVVVTGNETSLNEVARQNRGMYA